MKMHYRLLTTALSALGALALVVPSLRHLQAAQEKSTGSAVTQTVGNRAIPIKDVAEFDKVFTAKLNRAISENSTAALGSWIFKKSIFHSFVSECIIKCNNAKAASNEELTKLRDLIGAELKRAQSRKASIGDMAQGKISNSFFVGTVHKLSAAPKGN